VALFVVTQITALSHELQHVFHQHDVPCALHGAAVHLVAASPPDLAPAMAPPAQAAVMPTVLPAAPEHLVRPRGARAPPHLI
jgi:hypothetical protein